MKQLSILETFGLAQPDEIRIFETKMGVELPEYFKFFLADQNPFVVSEKNYIKGNRSFEVHHFYPLHADAELSLMMVNSVLKDHFNGSFVVFADDSGGWLYILSVRKEDYGKVYFCRMDEELENALTLLADSFEEFINGLAEEEIID